MQEITFSDRRRAVNFYNDLSRKDPSAYQFYDYSKLNKGFKVIKVETRKNNTDLLIMTVLFFLVY